MWLENRDIARDHAIFAFLAMESNTLLNLLTWDKDRVGKLDGVHSPAFADEFIRLPGLFSFRVKDRPVKNGIR